jgi:molybdate transport system substrate-binding protein
MKTHTYRAAIVAVAFGLVGMSPASAADIKVLSAGAFKQVVVALVPGFEKQTGHKVTIDNGTVGELKKRIEGGEAFDVAVISPGVVDELTAAGKLTAGSKTALASVGIGVMVKVGAPKPDISTVDAFKKALLAAKTVAYIDPASGGSSGVYLEKLFEKMGIADQVKPKAKLKNGGYVAELIVSGEAELGIHQISEIVPVKEVVLVGPLPKEIQNSTTYAAGLGASAKDKAAAEAFIKYLSGPDAAAVLKSKGMDKAS